jgi:hypothetical protein
MSKPVQWCLLKKGSRVFGLLGKATPYGLTAFSRDDVAGGWALTAEYGALRLERLAGDEDVIESQIFLPTPFSYDYGITGDYGYPEVERSVFGLLSSELEQLVTVLRRGSFPVLGFSHTDLRCSISSTTIPGYWPHIVTSNLALYGNVVSLEAFVRVVVSSLPQGQLCSRYPALQPVFKQMMRLMVLPRKGVPYTREMLELAPTPALAIK